MQTFVLCRNEPSECLENATGGTDCEQGWGKKVISQGLYELWMMEPREGLTQRRDVTKTAAPRVPCGAGYISDVSRH